MNGSLLGVDVGMRVSLTLVIPDTLLDVSGVFLLPRPMTNGSINSPFEMREKSRNANIPLIASFVCLSVTGLGVHVVGNCLVRFHEDLYLWARRNGYESRDETRKCQLIGL